MAVALRQKVGFEEFMQWPERRPYLEYIHGEVREKSMPTFPHSLTQSELAKRLGLWADQAGGWVVTEQGCILSTPAERHTVLPDVAYFGPDAFSVLPPGAVSVPPLLAVEILSPDDSYGDVEEKVATYLAALVPLVWVVDPVALQVTVHRVGQAPEVVQRNGRLTDPRLSGLQLELSTLFAKLIEARG